MARALAALEIYGRYCGARGSTRSTPWPRARSATPRTASEFLERAREALGHAIRILSAEEEAFVGYVAAVNSTTLRDGAVLDLGGGSLQLARVAGRELVDAGSWPLGAVRMTERFLPDGVATKDGMKAVRRHAQKRLAKVDWLPAADRIVALGGAARNLAAAAAAGLGLADRRRGPGRRAHATRWPTCATAWPAGSGRARPDRRDQRPPRRRDPRRRASSCTRCSSSRRPTASR